VPHIAGNDWNASLAWTYNDCIQLVSTSGSPSAPSSRCIKDVPCRANEPDTLTKMYKQIDVVCQFQLSLPPPAPIPKQINLPFALNFLQDVFILHEGEFLLSNNQQYQLNLTNGNLFIFNTNTTNILFQTNTQYPTSFFGTYNLAMESSGNLILQDNSGTIVWKSGTSGSASSRYKAELQNDGSLFIINAAGTIIWSTSAPNSATTTTGSVTGAPNTVAPWDQW